MFFGKAEAVELDAQGRLLIPQRLRNEVGIRKEVVVLGVFDRVEIWDKDAQERYEQTHGGAYHAGTLEPGSRSGAGIDEGCAAERGSSEPVLDRPRRDDMAALVGLGLLAARIFG